MEDKYESGQIYDIAFESDYRGIECELKIHHAD